MPVSMRSLATMLLLLVLPSAASAVEVVVGPNQLDVALLAEELDLPGTEEAAVLVVAGLGLDGLEVGFEPVPLKELEGIERNPPLLLRGLPEGLINVSLSRDELSWDGQLRLFGGRVTKLDADEVLRTAQAREGGVAAVAPSFDLFGFYDTLDERPDAAARLAFCQETLGNLDAATVDHRLVGQACDKVRADKEREDREAQALLGADELGDALAVDGAQDAPIKVGLVYRRDGRPRLVAPGTGARLAGIGAATLAGAIFTYSTVFWETQAQQEYLQFRRAERVGDQLGMSRHLFFTKSFDERRDGFGTAAALSFTSAISTAIWQAIESARFRKARVRVLGDAAGRKP